MTLEPGDVVALKSSSQPMTVVAIHHNNGVECVWIGEEGEFFRETIPAVALLNIGENDDAEDDGDETDVGHETDADTEVGEDDEAAGGRRVA